MADDTDNTPEESYWTIMRDINYVDYLSTFSEEERLSFAYEMNMAKARSLLAHALERDGRSLEEFETRMERLNTDLPHARQQNPEAMQDVGPAGLRDMQAYACRELGMNNDGIGETVVRLEAALQGPRRARAEGAHVPEFAWAEEGETLLERLQEVHRLQFGRSDNEDRLI